MLEAVVGHIDAVGKWQPELLIAEGGGAVDAVYGEAAGMVAEGLETEELELHIEAGLLHLKGAYDTMVVGNLVYGAVGAEYDIALGIAGFEAVAAVLPVFEGYYPGAHPLGYYTGIGIGLEQQRDGEVKVAGYYEVGSAIFGMNFGFAFHRLLVFILLHYFFELAEPVFP